MVRCGALATKARKSMFVETSFADALVRECTNRVWRNSLRAPGCCQVVAWLYLDLGISRTGQIQSPERDWTFGDSRFCVQLCIETLCKRATLVAHLTNFSFEFCYEIFTEDASLLFLYHGAKKSKMAKNSNQGGTLPYAVAGLLVTNRDSKASPFETPTTLHGRHFFANDRTPTMAGSPACPRPTQDQWVLPPISRDRRKYHTPLLFSFVLFFLFFLSFSAFRLERVFLHTIFMHWPILLALTFCFASCLMFFAKIYAQGQERMAYQA